MILVESLSLTVGTFRLENLSFSVPTGRYAVLMGKTGCGKSTVLEAICGLKTLRTGSIRLDNRDVTNLAPAQRQVGYVPQDLALFPTCTVRQHLSFALELRRCTPDFIAYRVEELAGLLGIQHLLHRYPQGLSGGESQRVALGRALSFQPSVLLLDEPLSALDEETRDEIIGLLRSVQRVTGVTVLHVTHNPREAEVLADIWLRLRDGVLSVQDSGGSRRTEESGVGSQDTRVADSCEGIRE
jgi:ABC-type sugar transport system ATPase subunit